MVRCGWVACIVLALCAGCAGSKSYPLDGTWSVTHGPSGAYELQFGPGVSYEERTTGSHSTARTTGTYRVEGNRLVLTPARVQLRNLKTGATSIVSAPPETYGIGWHGPDEAVLSAGNSTRRMVRAR